jgi:hypothetical protein
MHEKRWSTGLIRTPSKWASTGEPGWTARYLIRYKDLWDTDLLPDGSWKVSVSLWCAVRYKGELNPDLLHWRTCASRNGDINPALFFIRNLGFDPVDVVDDEYPYPSEATLEVSWMVLAGEQVVLRKDELGYWEP